MFLTTFTYCEGKAADQISKQHSSGFLTAYHENCM